jgi:hypothetical protein
MEVCIDSEPCETVSNVGATLWQQPVFFNGLDDGEHTVTITNGEAKPLLFDAVAVYGIVTGYV